MLSGDKHVYLVSKLRKPVSVIPKRGREPTDTFICEWGKPIPGKEETEFLPQKINPPPRQKGLTLFFSPHPDDLVYSAFSALIDPSNKKVAVTVFNLSRFTKWGLGSPRLISAFRKLEDRLAFTLLGIKSFHLDQPDTSLVESKRFPLKLLYRPNIIYSPLGVGSHPDHLMTRGLAVHVWLEAKRIPRLLFYEDLPYAARCENYGSVLETLSREVGLLKPRFIPLSDYQLRLKMLFSRLYITQTDNTSLLRQRAEENGLKSGVRYAEKLFEVAF